MTLHKILKACIIIGLFCFSGNAFAAINFTVTPLKYNIEVNPGGSVTRTAQIRNNGTGSVTLTTGSSDFQANGTGGVPSFVRYSELVHADQQLSSWITIDTPSITLAPGETKGFNFNIDVPTTATPGGHYGAVFFKNPNSESSAGAEIGINVDYGIILLVNVSGDVIVEIEIEDVVIKTGGGGGGGPGGGGSNIGKDNCPFGDLTSSNFDGKCIDNPFKKDDEENNDNDDDDSDDDSNEDGNNASEDEGETNNESENFEVTFQLPIENNGNTHVQPIGKIKLIDESGKEIPGIGKEIKKNDYGAVIGEEIVDYLPLNDEGGNVLPKTRRNFETTWKGFPYKSYDDRGNPVINYWKPGEYYTNKNLADNRFMMPWERVCTKKQEKVVQAVIEVSYKDENGDLVEYNSADEFKIEYTEEYVGLNPYVIIPIIIALFLWLGSWFIIGKMRVPCISKNCKARFRRGTEICPECLLKQSEKIIKPETKKKVEPKKKKGKKKAETKKKVDQKKKTDTKTGKKKTSKEKSKKKAK